MASTFFKGNIKAPCRFKRLFKHMSSLEPNHVDMVGHNDVGVDIGICVLLAPCQVFDDEIVKMVAGKHVYPVDYS